MILIIVSLSGDGHGIYNDENDDVHGMYYCMSRLPQCLCYGDVYDDGDNEGGVLDNQ